ncbi:hypothetical protein CDAR_192901 [Caerostris darwini]|uniref:Uncharacterized protein n=1 Tax=Caerostris darwini TaxID=1538125 RepID=A0AAV4S2U5_9ARAC|nr:hypothetical protein CDAR_192901 [Caerostris darwini]
MTSAIEFPHKRSGGSPLLLFLIVHMNTSGKTGSMPVGRGEPSRCEELSAEQLSIFLGLARSQPSNTAPNGIKALFINIPRNLGINISEHQNTLR